MTFEVKHALIKRDSLDESFQLFDEKQYFSNDDVLVAIDSNTLISIQILLHTINTNDFKKWKKIKKTDEIDDISSLFVKLGYNKKDILELLQNI
ncbi:MAG: hypothetical protein LBM96_04210 [Methanobrevibacter sp.]|jgi:hypothetical protein|nr:hypothetical protein [Candidatus Methanoflexus mossambicus]